MKSPFRHDLSLERVDGPALCMECYTSTQSADKCVTCMFFVCQYCILETSVRWKHEICRPLTPHRGVNDQV